MKKVVRLASLQRFLVWWNQHVAHPRQRRSADAVPQLPASVAHAPGPLRLRTRGGDIPALHGFVLARTLVFPPQISRDTQIGQLFRHEIIPLEIDFFFAILQFVHQLGSGHGHRYPGKGWFVFSTVKPRYSVFLVTG